MKKNCKYIVITGGVISGLGKGVTTASIGSLLARNFKVLPIKCDGYLNTDPGTLNPLEHGEVYVLEDGGEVDMDFGHYERFINVSAKKSWNITMGKIYQSILQKERQGVYLGKTVQLIPYVTDEIKAYIYNLAEQEKAEVVLLEIGGTIGDIEIELFVESIRQMRNEMANTSDMMFVHLTYIPFTTSTEEPKSKPTQQSVRILNQAGIYPDVIICRSKKNIPIELKNKISLHCNISTQSVITGVDVKTLYQVPLLYEKEGLSDIIQQKLQIKFAPLSEAFKALTNKLEKINRVVDDKRVIDIALCGKYISTGDSYASIYEACHHCAVHLNVKVKLHLMDTVQIENQTNGNNQEATAAIIKELLINMDGVIVPGGFGSRGIEGKIEIIRYLRKNGLPFLGICLGMQLAVIEYCRNVCNLKDAHTTEIDNTTKAPVVTILPEQLKVKQKGGTMRLGGFKVLLKPQSLAAKIYGTTYVVERFRHRYEVNPEYVSIIEKHGMIFSGYSAGQKVMQILEVPQHPFFVASQFHSELISRLENPSPLFKNFLAACLNNKK